MGRHIHEITDDTKLAIGQRDAMDFPIVEYLDVAIGARFNETGIRIRLASFQRMPKGLEEGLDRFLRPDDLQRFFEVTANQVFDIAKDRLGPWIHLFNSPLSIHQINTDRRFVDDCGYL